MIKHGYPRLFAVNVTISGSLQPLLLPPSHNMIIYSLAAGGTVSVAQLFMGGIIPAPDVLTVKEYGVAEVFGPGTPTSAIVDYVKAWYAAQ